MVSKPLTGNKIKGNEEMSLFDALNPVDTGLAAGRFLLSPPLLLEGVVSPSETQQRTQFGQGAYLSGAGQFTFIEQSAPDVRRKLQCLDGVLGISLS